MDAKNLTDVEAEAIAAHWQERARILAARTPEQHRASKVALGDRIAAAKRAHGDTAWADRHDATR